MGRQSTYKRNQHIKMNAIRLSTTRLIIPRCKPSNLKLLSTTASKAPKVKKNINSVIEQLEKDQSDFKKKLFNGRWRIPCCWNSCFCLCFLCGLYGENSCR